MNGRPSGTYVLKWRVSSTNTLIFYFHYYKWNVLTPPHLTVSRPFHSKEWYQDVYSIHMCIIHTLSRCVRHLYLLFYCHILILVLRSLSLIVSVSWKVHSSQHNNPTLSCRSLTRVSHTTKFVLSVIKQWIDCYVHLQGPTVDRRYVHH